MRGPAVLVRKFHERGLRVTPQRERLFRILQEDGGHPTIEELHAAVRREMPTISLKTVYQIVYALEELGEVRILDVGTGSHRVELTVERSHHHLVCTGCGRVRDLFVDIPGLKLSPDQHEGFRLATAEVIFRGLCPDCAEHRQSSSADRAGDTTRAVRARIQSTKAPSSEPTATISQRGEGPTCLIGKT